jgi:hypothetical protein
VGGSPRPGPQAGYPSGGNRLFGEIAQLKIVCILSKIAFENLEKSL